MADRNREEYNERERRWRRRNEGEGFFDRVGNWLSGDDQDRDRQDNWQRERGYNRRNDRTYDQNASRYANRGPARNYGQDYDQDFDRNRNRDSEWERTRQWRQGGDREAGYNRQGQYGQNRNTSSDRYGQNYGRDRDYGYGEDFDYASDYGRSYNQGNRRYGDYNQEVNRDYAGDWESRRDRDFYGSGEYEQINRRYGQGRRYGQNFGRGYNRGQQVRSAGMGTDFNPEVNYENRDYDFGYESEGAFYQDLDEPAGYSYYEVWMIPGEFTGMGPSGYQRTDDRIFEDVCEYLTQHGRIDPSDVEVQVNNGEVTLTGTVPTREMKRLAEDSVDSISGVKEIHNEIKVRHQDREQDWRRDSGEDWDRQRSQTSYSARGGDRTAGGGTVAEGGVGTAGGVGTSSGVNTAAGAAATSSTASERRRDASRSAAGETTMGAGLTSEGSTSTGTGKRSQVMQGMEVIGKDGKVVGRVKEVRSNDFLVDRDMARDVFIPFDALQSVGAQAMLNIAAEDVDDQEWEKPDIL